jgi:hypothetical protein
MTALGLRLPVNDAVAIRFLDAPLAAAFVSRGVRRVEDRDQRRSVSDARRSAGAAGSDEASK